MTRRTRDPEAIARLDARFSEAPPEWQELFAELDRRDPKMRGGLLVQIVEGIKGIISRGGIRRRKFEAQSMPVDVAAAALLYSALCCEFRREPIHDLGELPDETDGLVGVRPGELVRALILAPDAARGRLFLNAVRRSAKRLSAVQAEISHDDGSHSLTVRRQDGNKVLFGFVVPANGRDNLRSTWVAGAIFDARLVGQTSDPVLADAIEAVKVRLLTGAISNFSTLE